MVWLRFSGVAKGGRLSDLVVFLPDLLKCAAAKEVFDEAMKALNHGLEVCKEHAAK
jgi:predicted RNase H-like HicB family nuclease